MKHYVKMVWPYVIWAALIIVLPLLLIILYSVTKNGNELVNIQFTLENFKRIGEPIYLEVLRKSGYALILVQRFVNTLEFFRRKNMIF